MELMERKGKLQLRLQDITYMHWAAYLFAGVALAGLDSCMYVCIKSSLYDEGVFEIKKKIAGNFIVYKRTLLVNVNVVIKYSLRSSC